MLEISPDPLKIPGNVSVSTNATVKTQMTAPITVYILTI